MVAEAVEQFHAAAGACLVEPEAVTLCDEDGLVPWDELPTAGHFKVARPCEGGFKRYATPDDKLQQQRDYAKHAKWVSGLGLSEQDFRHCLQSAPAVQYDRGCENIATCLRERGASVRRHAVLKCREAALKKAASDAGGLVCGDAAGAAKAVSAIGAFLSDVAARREAFAEVPAAWKKQGGLDLPDGYWVMSEGVRCVPGLFEQWLREVGALLLGSTGAQFWKELHATSFATLDPVLREFSLDGMPCKVLRQRAHLSHKRIQERFPVAWAWCALTWQSACAEVEARFGSACKIRLGFEGAGRVSL